MSPTQQRLPRRASTFHQGPSSASSSDSEDPAVPHPMTDDQAEQTRRKRLRSWKKWWTTRKVGQEAADQTSPASPTHDDGDAVTRTGSFGTPWWRFLPFLGRMASTRATTDISGSSYYYSDYTSDSEDVPSTTSKKKLKIFHYRVEETGISIDPGWPYFDSANFKREIIGDERTGPRFSRQLTAAFENAYSLPVPDNNIKLIHNDSDAMANILRAAFRDSKDSRWFSRHGSDLISRVESSGSANKQRHSKKKTQFFRITHDRKWGLVQSAFCINHWAIPLRDDDSFIGNRLQQLVVYWQYQWPVDKQKQEDEADLIPDVRNEDIEPELAAGVPTTPPAAKSRLRRRFATGHAGTKDSEKLNETLSRSNLIVVYEKSQFISRVSKKYHGPDSVALSSLSNFVTVSDLPFDQGQATDATEKSERFIGLGSAHLLNQIIGTIFEDLAENLDATIDAYFDPCARLEEQVYRRPEDDKLAKKLWEYSRAFQDAGRIVNLLTLLIGDIGSELARHSKEKELGRTFLENLLSRFRDLEYEVREELQTPVADMIDLVYKSVSIKDARLSLELNASLWRLSWVTFIFLPLTFLVGFFGMNVDTFSDDPSIKWYFITAVPFLICVMLSWLLFKYFMKKPFPLRKFAKGFSIGDVLYRKVPEPDDIVVRYQSTADV